MTRSSWLPPSFSTAASTRCSARSRRAARSRRSSRRFLEDSFAALKRRPAPARGAPLRGAPGRLRAREGGGRPGAPLAEALDPALPPLAEVAAPPRLHLPRPRRRGLPAPPRPPPRAAAAALIVGQRPLRFAFFFLLADGWQREELDFALNTVRAALDARLVDARVRGSFREAAEIQQSLLVEEPPHFPGYDIAARSIAAEEVGGDFYDFHDLGDGHARPLDRRRERPRPARGAPRARRGDGPAHGDREGAEGRPRLREAQPGDPPLAPLQPVRERLLRRSSRGRATSST